MALEQKLIAEQIVRTAGMSNRPGYYSGRGATISDLNSDSLEKIYVGIKDGHGERLHNNILRWLLIFQS